MNLSTNPKKINGGLVSRMVDDELLIVDQINGKIHQLNLTAMFILNQVDGNNSVDQIVAKTLEEFDMDEDQVRTDVENTLESLVALKLIAFSAH